MKILALVLALLLSVPTLAGVKPPKNKFERKVYNATFALYGTHEGDTRFLCTATAYEKTPGGYHLISAGHCAVLEDVTFSVAEQIGEPMTPVTVVKAEFDSERDFSIFELKTKKRYPVIPLGSESALRIGDRVLCANFTEGLAEHLSRGLVSSREIYPKEEVSGQKDHFMVQIYAGPGASGSAIISYKTHKIVAIVVGGFRVNIGADVEPISQFGAFLNSKS